jgi:hypothetical protein
MTREEAFRQAADAYRALLASWTDVTLGSAMRTPTQDDAVLAHPPEPGQERGWLQRFLRRMQDWLEDARRTVGADRARLVARMRAALERAEEAARAGAETTRDLIDPITNMSRILDTEFGWALGGGLALAMAAVAIYLLWNKRRE